MKLKRICKTCGLEITSRSRLCPECRLNSGIEPIDMVYNHCRKLIKHHLNIRVIRDNDEIIIPEILGIDLDSYLAYLITTNTKINPYEDDFSIDHRLPLSRCKNISTTKRLMHYTNTQLVTQSDNSKMKNRLTDNWEELYKQFNLTEEDYDTK